MSRPPRCALRRLVTVLLLIGIPGLAALVGWVPSARRERPAHAPLSHAAFRILPWSRIECAPGEGATWRIPLGPRDPALAVRVLGTSCGCAGARVEEDVLCVTLAGGRQPARVRVNLGVTRGAARTRRTLSLVPVRREPSRPTLVVQHLPPRAPTAEGGAGLGLLHARLRCADRVPPRLVSEAPLRAVCRPHADGGWSVLVSGHASTADVARPGALQTAAGRIPLRVFRRAPDVR